MNNYRDEYIMKQVQEGDLDACGVLYRRYKSVLYTFFYNNCKDQMTSEDLVHHTFEKIIKYRKNFTGKGSFKAWMFSVARNAYVDDYRKRKKHASEPIIEAVTESIDTRFASKTDEENVDLELLDRCLRMLAPEKRELLTMTKLNGMKYKEICEVYGLTESNLKVKIFRIMKELKENMNYLTKQKV